MSPARAVPSVAALSRWLALSAAAGAVVWLGGVVARPPGVLGPGWRLALLTFAPLVAAPLVLRLVRPGSASPLAQGLWKAAALLQLPGALALFASSGLAPGPRAGAWALPWLAATGAVALYGLARLREHGRSLPALCATAGLLYLAVGGGWAVLARLGARPLGFGDVIVALTAVHFHYAGLVLPVLTGLAAARVGGRTASWAAAGVIAGVPLVAVGITATQAGVPPGLEAAAALLTAAAGLLVAWLHLRLALSRGAPAAARLLWGVAAAALAIGMVLAAAYGARSLVPLYWLSIPLMQAVHGSANALGFALAGVLGWSVALSNRGDAGGIG